MCAGFDLIQRRLRASRPCALLLAATPVLTVFDVLHLDGADVCWPAIGSCSVSIDHDENHDSNPY